MGILSKLKLDINIFCEFHNWLEKKKTRKKNKKKNPEP